MGRNTLNWKGRGEPPRAESPCWLLPASEEAAVSIAREHSALSALGWRLFTCDAGLIKRLGHKARLRDIAEEAGLLSELPEHYASAAEAQFPCMLKSTSGCFGKDIHIVRSREELDSLTQGGFGSAWVLQELVRGSSEYSVSLLVE